MGLIKTVAPSGQCALPTEPDECFKPFILTAYLSLTRKSEDQRPIVVLRDTGGSQLFILSGILPLGGESACDASTVVRAIGMSFVPAPLHHVHISSNLVSVFFPVAVRSCFPINGIDFIMGNDIAGGKVYPTPEVVDIPIPESENDELAHHHPNVFTSCVLTRAQAKVKAEVDLSDSLFASILFEENVPPIESVTGSPAEPGRVSAVPAASLPLTRAALKAQKDDRSLAKCFAAACEDPIKNGEKQCFFVDEGVLMRKWMSQPGDGNEDWSTVYQIVIPSGWRQHVLELAHEQAWSGHLGVPKTYNHVLKHFFWPGMKADVRHFCKTCNTCQIVGKPNQVVPPAPLHPIPAVGEPFARHCRLCGPFAGNHFLLTIMCVSTRFPEAIPLKENHRTHHHPSFDKILHHFWVA